MRLFYEVMEPGQRAFWAILKTDAAPMPQQRGRQIGWTERKFDVKRYPKYVLREVRENGYTALKYLRGLS